MNLSTSFEKKKEAYLKDTYPTCEDRRACLVLIKQMLQDHGNDMAKAISKDFSYRCTEETLYLEIFPTINAIDYCIKHLKRWMKPQKRKVSWFLQPGQASVIPQPLGVVGVMVPWNYPLFLSIVPIVYAIAAGNRVLVKYSEFTPKIGKLIATLIKENLSDWVEVINGELEVSVAFSNLPFAHMLFTGSTGVGKQVMAAASKNLTSVTLELGGKSPAIISNTVNKDYLTRLFMGKLYNAGQTCIAPDYLLIPTSFAPMIESQFNQFMEAHYPNLLDSPDYTAIIADHHVNRLRDLVDDATKKGARAICYGHEEGKGRKFPAHLIFNVDMSMQLMQEEIFGPILPVLTYDTLDEAIQLIRSLPNPLALYYFGHDKEEINTLKFKVLSGALTINDTLTHSAIDDLPFGGVGASGMGQYHGKEGFETLSKYKPVFVQRKISPLTWFYPPYGRLIKTFLRYFAGIKN